jgi:peptidoglycan/LPS O-acetylase OafA/YrhL
LAVLGLGLAGAALLVMADLSTLVEIEVVGVVQETLQGGDQHSWSMVVLGVAAVPLAFGAARGRSRPAMLGLALIGLVAAFIALVADLPDTRETGVYGERYEQASAAPGSGFYFETAGAALLLLAGGGGLVLLPPRPEPARRPRNSAVSSATASGRSSGTNE